MGYKYNISDAIKKIQASIWAKRCSRGNQPYKMKFKVAINIIKILQMENLCKY